MAFPALPYWLWPGDDRPTEEIDDEIVEELRLHLELLEEEQARRGVPRDEAKRYAAERFGDFDAVLRRCRAEKQGDLPMLKRVQAVLTLLLFVGVVILGVRDYVTANTTAQYMDQTTKHLFTIQNTLTKLSDDLSAGGEQGGQAFGGYGGGAYGGGYGGEYSADAVQPTASPPPLFPAEIEGDHQKLLREAERELHAVESQQQLLRAELEEVERARAELQATDAVGEAERNLRLTRATLKAAEAKLELASEAAERVSELEDMGRESRQEMLSVKQAEIDARSAVTLERIRVEEADYQLQRAVTQRDSRDGKLNAEARRLNTALKATEAKIADARQQLFDAKSQAATEAVRKTRSKADLTGTVNYTNGKPVADADVLLIVKTWPNNRFRQDDYAVKTDASGVFQLKGRIPLDGQYGINAAVVAEGQAIASKYVLVEDPAGNPPEDLSFQLQPSAETRIVVTNTAGQPIARALVAPSGRVASDDTEHNVYHQGSNPVWKKTDADGAVTVDWFAEGDLGLVRIRPRGGDWQEKKFDLADANDGTITIAVED
ncbi:MAG: permease prefix domain 1-containing protein [Planctomycetota bacterium]